MKNYITKFIVFIKYIIKKFFQDNCFESVSALTYTTILSLVPLMAVAIYIVQSLPHFQDFWFEAEKYIFSHFVPATGREVEQYLKQFASQTLNFTIIGSIFLVISAIIMIYTTEQVFNRIFEVQSNRSILKSLRLYFSILFFTPILVGSSFAISSYLWTDILEHISIISILLELTPMILVWLCLSLVYKILPNCYVRLSYAVLGALIAAILFEISKNIFTEYVSGITLNYLIYGAFSTVPFFLLWIYISWMIILIGAQIVHALNIKINYKNN